MEVGRRWSRWRWEEVEQVEVGRRWSKGGSGAGGGREQVEEVGRRWSRWR